MTILKYIPFTYHWIVRKAIGDGVRTVLDLGCGEGGFMRAISSGERWEVVGVELFPEALKKARQSGIYTQVIRADVRKLPSSITNNRYDVVFVSQVLEHLKKKDGLKALNIWARMAKKRLVVSTPIGFIKYEPIEKNDKNNPLQKHLSGWNPSEFISLGFSLWGQGARFIYGTRGLARNSPSILPFWGIVSLIVSPLVYYFPHLGTYMITVKEINA